MHDFMMCTVLPEGVTHIQKDVGPLPRAPKKPIRSPKNGIVQAMNAISTTYAERYTSRISPSLGMPFFTYKSHAHCS